MTKTESSQLNLSDINGSQQTFPKISLILFPEGDMIGFFSGDFVRGSWSSSRVFGLRQESPLDLVAWPPSWDLNLLPDSSLAGDFRP